VSDAPREGVQVLFGHKKNNEALPFDPACPEHLSAHRPVYPRQPGKKKGWASNEN